MENFHFVKNVYFSILKYLFNIRIDFFVMVEFWIALSFRVYFDLMHSPAASSLDPFKLI